jgi:drug/metabolite transporter (DMT)-like permease
MPRLTHRLGPILTLALTAAIYGGTFPAAQYGVRSGLSASTFLALRFTVAAMIVGLVLVIRHVRPTRRALRDGILLGAIITVAYWFQTDGLRLTTSTKSSFVTGLFVIFTPLASIFAGQKVRPRHAAAAAIGVIGLYGLVREPGASWNGWNTGDTETLICAGLFGIQTYLAAQFSRRSDVLVLVFAQITVVAVLSAALTICFPERFGSPNLSAALSPGTLAVAFWLQFKMQAKLEATEAAILLSLEPLFATLLAVSGWVPGIQEHLSTVQWTGAALVLFAPVLAEWGNTTQLYTPAVKPIA